MTLSATEELALETVRARVGERPRPLQILVLEDDEADRMRLARVVKRAGLDAVVTEAPDIGSFCERLRERSYDIVFIDFWLDFDTGLDALHMLMAEPGQERAVPVMLSRATEPEVIVEAMRTGCADYIVKDTLDVEALRSCIAAAFERRVLMAALREGEDLRRAIRRLVERLAKGQVPGFAESAAGYKPPAPKGGLAATAEQRLSSGLLAELERLWHLRRHQSPS